MRTVSRLRSLLIVVAGLTAHAAAQAPARPSARSPSPSALKQVAFVKASNTGEKDDVDEFGYSVALSSDGNTLAVGAIGEDSAAKGINGNQADNSANGAGAVYVFNRTGGAWAQQAYVKSSNTARN